MDISLFTALIRSHQLIAKSKVYTIIVIYCHIAAYGNRSPPELLQYLSMIHAAFTASFEALVYLNVSVIAVLHRNNYCRLLLQ